MNLQHGPVAAGVASGGGRGLVIVGLVVIAGIGFSAVVRRRRRTTRRSQRPRLSARLDRSAANPEPQPGPASTSTTCSALVPADANGLGEAGATAVISERPGRPPPWAAQPTADVASEWAVEAHGLTKRFGTHVAVDNIDILVPRGSAFGYLGPNGAGKTTLIRVLLGLTKADSGTMSLVGVPVPAQRGRALAMVGAIVDEPRFHGHLTGRQNLRILAAARGGGAKEQIGPALVRTGLTHRADDKVSAYSMGMRQRLGLAACLLADPQLLILDEPMNGLDPGGIHEMRDMLRGLVDEGRTVMLSSHLLDEVERTCDEVAIVDQGRVIQQGPIDELTAGAGVVVQVQCGDPPTAARALSRELIASSVAVNDDGLTVTLADGPARELTAEINRRLVEAGVAVYSLRPDIARLEDWFLSVTSRLGSE